MLSIVRQSPGPGQEIRTSTSSGTDAVWPRPGHELLFRQGESVFAMEVATTPAQSPFNVVVNWTPR